MSNDAPANAPATETAASPVETISAKEKFEGILVPIFGEAITSAIYQQWVDLDTLIQSKAHPTSEMMKRRGMADVLQHFGITSELCREMTRELRPERAPRVLKAKKAAEGDDEPATEAPAPKKSRRQRREEG